MQKRLKKALKAANFLRLGVSFALFSVVILSSCNSEDDEVTRIFEAAFSSSASGLAELNSTSTIEVKFSTATITDAVVTVEVAETDVTAGTDFETSLSITDGVIEIPVATGAESVSFTVTRLAEFIDAGAITFTLVSIEGEENVELVGNTTHTVSFEKVVSQSGVINLLTGGSTYPNQCYIDLSTGTQVAVRRDTWELNFYNGSENRVFLNSSIKAAAAALPGVTDLNSVSSTYNLADSITLYYYPDFATKTEIKVGSIAELTAGLPVGYTQYGDEDNGIIFTDKASGNLNETAISEISTTDSENVVYIVSLGNEIPMEAAEEGSINISGASRGFMKIRILSDGNSYTIQYADLDATTYQEATISKSGINEFTGFSLETGEIVDVEPTNWDINFSGVFSYYSGGFGLTYSDYGLHNTLGGVELYALHSEDLPGGFGSSGTPANTDKVYENFTLADVDESLFVSDNRTTIGSSWRSTSQGIAYDYMYFIAKDAENNYYKIQFSALLSEDGERGYSQFKYDLLQ